MKKEEQNKKKAGLGYGMIVVLVIGIMFGYMAVQPQLEIDERGWHVIWEGSLADAAEADPGAGNSGILGVYILNHTGTPADAYNENDSVTHFEAWASANNLGFATADATDVEIAYDTSFDIVVRVRGSSTHCKRDSTWYDTDLKVEITSADLSISSDTAMTRVTPVAAGNTSSFTFLYVNFYIDNSGSGYTLSKGETNEITSIKFSAYY
jgi:hypothetical protein